MEVTAAGIRRLTQVGAVVGGIGCLIVAVGGDTMLGTIVFVVGLSGVALALGAARVIDDARQELRVAWAVAVGLAVTLIAAAWIPTLL